MQKLFKNKLSFFTLAVFLFFIVALTMTGTGCDSDDAPESDTTGEGEETVREGDVANELIIGLGRDFHYGPEDRSFLHGSTNVWESLTYLDENLEAVPELAESFSSSEDGTVWTFKIREGVVFHDGAELDAEVVKKNIERASRHTSLAPNYNTMTEIRVTDPMTVEIVLSEPSPTFPELISYHGSPIFSPNVIDDEGTDISAPIGTGPYVFKEYRDEQIYLEANPDYHRGKPSIDKVVFYHIPDENTRVSALKAGDVNALADVGVILPDQVPDIEDYEGINIKTVDVLTSIYLHFQNDNSPVNDAALRRGISKLIDRDELVEVLNSGFGTPAEGIMSPLASYWIKPDTAPRFAPEEAKEIFEEADLSEAVDILVCANWARRWPILSIAQYLQTELNNAGFNVSMRSLEMGAYMDEAREGNYHITFTPWTGSDPDDYFRGWIQSDGSFNTARGLFYSNPDADELIAAGRKEMDRERRREIYNQLQDIVSEEMPMTPIYHDMTIYATKDFVKDFEMDFNFKADLHRASIQ